MRAFIVRPFGTRSEIDFDRVEKLLIGPALNRIGATGGTTSEIMEAGNIRIDMFRELLAADLVVADISTNNPNVFYELGIRHSLQEKRTFLIRAKTRSPQALAQDAKKEEVPFDLKTDRYFEYDPTCPEQSVETLIQALRQTIDSEKQDSPVFLLLPDLKPQEREHFLPVPLSFAEEAQKAQSDNDPTKLTLLSLEPRGCSWESTGLRLVGRALLAINQTRVSKTAWEILLNLDQLDLEANINLGNIYQRLGELTESDQALDRALRCATAPHDLAEIYGQMGRNKKDRWVKAWSDQNPADQATQAIKSPWLVDAYEQYLLAYRQDLNCYYPGLNALALAVVILELATRFPEIWKTSVGDESEASQKLADIKKKCDQLSRALQLHFDSAGDEQDKWLLSSAGDHCLLTLPNANRALFFYRKAAEEWGPFVLDSVARQLNLFKQLGVMKDKVEEALASLPPVAASAGSAQIERILLFTGHRIDSAKRPTPRFPPSKEPQAKEAIRQVLLEQKANTPDSLFGVAGGANGGDILFLELCEELSIPTDMLLALPEDQFVDASVASEDPSWERRFYAQLQKHPRAPVLAQSPDLPRWLRSKSGYDIWQRNNLWLLSRALSKGAKHVTLIALWDGEAGDGPGGTEHMVDMAKERGARVVHLNTKELFALA
jgi:tetratricopeptide (TPR) repeat protein